MDDDKTPAATGPEDPTVALNSARAETEHYKRIIAALIKRFGPIHFHPGEYTATDPDDLFLLGITEDDMVAGRRPTFALREQVRPDGQLVHRLVSTAAVIASTGIDGAPAIAAARRLHETWLMATDTSPTFPDAIPQQREGSDG